jgi:hypothetical protein
MSGKTLGVLTVLTLVLGGVAGREARADTCTFTDHPASDFGLPEALTGPTVSVRHCTVPAGVPDTLHAMLALGPGPRVAVSGPYLAAGACLVAHGDAEVWPGFENDIVAKLCHEPDGSWRPRISGTLVLAGTMVDLVDAVVEQLDGRDGPVSLALPNLALGPVAVSDASIDTEVVGGVLQPVAIAGTVRWSNSPNGPQLQLEGAFPAGAVDIGVTFDDAPADFPFPGIQLPPLAARLLLDDKSEWRLLIRVEGPAQLGALGTLDLTGSELDVQVRDGQWAMAGCLATQPGTIDLGIIRFTQTKVEACGEPDAVRVSLAGQAELAVLALPAIAVTGEMTYANAAWTAALTAASSVPLGPFGTVALSGSLTLAGTPGAATVDGCLRGDASLSSLAGVPASLTASVGRCTAGSQALAIAVDGTLSLPGSTAHVHGDLFDPGSADWSIHMDAEDLVLGAFVIDHATLDAAPGELAIGGDFHVGPLHLTANGEIAPMGAFDVSVGLLSPVALPGGITITDAAGSHLRWTGSQWQLVLTVGVIVDAGPFGLITARGSLEAILDTITGAFSLSGCVDATAAPANLPITAAHASVCWTASGGVEIHVDGTILSAGVPVAVSGTLVLGAGGPAIDLSIAGGPGQTLTLAPGVVLSDVHFTIAPAIPGMQLSGTLCVAELCFTISGQYVPGGVSTLSASIAAGAPGWKPIASLPFTLTGGITGTLTVDAAAGTAALDVTATSTQSLSVVPGLTLSNAFARGRITAGAWSVAIGGTTTIALGASSVSVSVESTLASTGAWSFTGTAAGSFDPLGAMIGAGRFVVSNPTFTIAIPAGGSPGITFTANLAFCLLGGCNASNPALTATVRGGIVASPTGVWFAASVPGVTIPGLGTAAASVVATTVPLPNFDIDATPGTTADDLNIVPGVTLTATVDLPIEFGSFKPRARAVLALADPINMSATASILLDLPILTPNTMPGVESLKLTSLSMTAAFVNGAPTFAFSGEVAFKPTGPNSTVLTGTTKVSFSLPATIGLDLSLVGTWVQPFGLPDVAIQNPTFAASIDFSATPVPIPTRIGFNGDLYWKKSGSWPATPQGWSPLPSHIAHLGGTVYFDAMPSPSALAGIPLPTLVVRFDMQNLGTGDLVAFANNMKTGARNVLLGLPGFAGVAALIPTSAFSMSLPAPLDITIKKLELYLSTHNATLMELPFTAGFRAVLDATISGKSILMRGVLDDKGLLLEGRLSPLSVLGLSLTGDPTRQIIQPGTGSVTVPHDARMAITAGTLEAQVKAPAAGGTIVSRIASNKGYSLKLLAAQGGLSPIELVIGNGTTTTFTTAPIVPIDTWHHVAVAFSSAGTYAYLDGAPVTFATIAPALPVPPAGTPAPAPVAGPPTATALTVGTGLTNVDEVRVWNVARSGGEISRDQSLPPFTAYSDTRLVVRLAADFDKGVTAAVANNSRFFTPTTALHGSYTGAAKSVVDPREQNLLARLRIALPGAGESGLALRAGAAIDLPPLGGSKQAVVALDVNSDNATGKLFMRESPLFTLPGFGSLIVGGKGENMNAGDFDDGVFGAFDVKALAIAATAGLYFQPTTGTRQTLFDGSFSWLCPTATCATASSRRLTLDGAINWTAPLPGGGTMNLAGTAHYGSDIGALSVNGSLSVFGQTLSASAIKVSNTGIKATTTVNLDAVPGIPDMGSSTLEMNLTFNPPRLCGTGQSSIKLPGSSTVINGLLSVCLGDTQTVTFEGDINQLTLGGITITGAHVSYGDAGLRVSGNVNIAGVFSGSVSGLWVSASNFSLTANGGVTLGGFTVANGSVELEPDGVFVRGNVTLAGIAKNGFTVEVQSNGTFTLTASGDVTLSGFLVDNATLTLTKTGLTVAGTLKFLGNSISVSGAAYSDGAFSFAVTASITIGGWPMANADIDFNNYTTDHPKPAWFPPAEGLRVAGSISIPGGTLSMNTEISSPTNFSFTASPSLTMSGYALASTEVRLSAASGLRIEGIVSIGSTDVTVSGTVGSLTTWELCSATNIDANMASGLPDLKGKFCLARESGSTQLSGSGTAKLWGMTFSTSFDINTSGGIEYLMINVAVESFSILGVTASGRIKIRVDDNDLTYARWYGSLYVPNPVPGWDPLVDFDSYLNMSGEFEVCPSDFGIDPTDYGLPSGCVELEI